MSSIFHHAAGGEQRWGCVHEFGLRPTFRDFLTGTGLSVRLARPLPLHPSSRDCDQSRSRVCDEIVKGLRRADIDAGGGLTQPARALHLGGLNRPRNRGKDNRGGARLSNGRHPPIHSCAKMTSATKSRPTRSMIGRRHKKGNRQLRGAGQAVRRLAKKPAKPPDRPDAPIAILVPN
jgi:hypothetical protein